MSVTHLCPYCAGIPKDCGHGIDSTCSHTIEAYGQMEQQIAWLNDNSTFYDTEGMSSAVPVLASVSKRIWYHATDDVDSYPFSDVMEAALAPKDSDKQNPG
jgi:hypothetical protein